jgi:hypothetical protein
VAAALLVSLVSAAGAVPPDVTIPDHAVWDRLLKQYVNENYRVDYARLQQEALPGLDGYLAELAKVDYSSLSASEQKAFLINDYNALTVRWILHYYPLRSIWATPDPFKKARHTLGGRLVSLDDIESLLRQTGDPRIHAALVCAARSCPPLRREAYSGTQIESQLEDNTRRWLADPGLNRFDAGGRADVSPIFKWYREDFESQPAGLAGFLKKYAPQPAGGNGQEKDFDIHFNEYNWGLNDRSDLGKDHSGFDLVIDKIRSWFR